MLKRLIPLLAAMLLAVVPLASTAQAKKDTMVIGMALEPPGLDPTAGAASAIAEIVLYNVFETLTRINADGNVTPLLAESWEISPDLKTYTFKLRKDAKFQNGEPFNAQTVKYSFERAAGEKSSLLRSPLPWRAIASSICAVTSWSCVGRETRRTTPTGTGKSG